MPFIYTFAKEPLRLGEDDPKYGQRWWCEVNEHLEPVSFNLTGGKSVSLSDKISAEERTEKQTHKGKNYIQLKKVTIEGGQVRQSSANPDSSVKEQLDRIEKKLDQLLGIDEELTTEPLPEAPADYGDEEGGY